MKYNRPSYYEEYCYVQHVIDRAKE